MKTINKLLLTLVYISFLTILFHADYYHGTVSQVCGLSQYTIHPNGTVDKSGELQCVKFSQYDLDRQDAFDNITISKVCVSSWILIRTIFSESIMPPSFHGIRMYSFLYLCNLVC